MGSLNSYFSSFCSGISNFLQVSKTSPKSDQSKMNQARRFFLRNERAILFTLSAGMQLFMSPRMLTIGAFGGAYIQMKYGNSQYIKKLKINNEILSLFEASTAFTGAAGTVIRQVYPRKIFEISPLLTGVALGSVGVKLWIHTWSGPSGNSSVNPEKKPRGRGKKS